VREGSLTYRASSDPVGRVLRAGTVKAIPPGVAHEIEPAGDARFFVEFLDVVRRPSGSPAGRCPGCGCAPGSAHVGGCASA
jgi:hypothetical protein